jgi:hypothetical protein
MTGRRCRACCSEADPDRDSGLQGANTDSEGFCALAGDDGGAGARVLRLLVLFIAAIFRPKALLIAENLCLRQQLVALQRRHPRPRLSNADRRFWIVASRWLGGWRNLLLIVKPKTVLGCQRLGWRAHWTWRSSCRTSGDRPAIPAELHAFIGRMAAENRLWGQKAHSSRVGEVRVSSFCQNHGEIYARVPQGVHLQVRMTIFTPTASKFMVPRL